MQSSTALVELVESVELCGKEHSGSFAALQFVSRRLDLGIVDDVRFVVDRSGNGRSAGRPEERVASGSAAGALNGELRKEIPPLLIGSPEEYDSHYGTVGGAMNTGSRNRQSRVAGVAEGAGLAHDAGNLLGALSLYSELLGAPGVLHEEYREYATELRLLSERSSAMIARLMERAHTLSAEEDCELTTLPDVVARCRGLLSRTAGRRLEVSFGFGSDRPVNVPGEVVERILTNLVKNAAEAIGEGNGSISVHVAGAGNAADPRVILTVSDNGRGMTKAALGSLGMSTAPEADGHGLGFRVVRELAAMSDGCLAVASAPGDGTTVSVEWRAIEQVEVEVGESTRRVLRGEAGWIAC
jgi:signal transduction histidine kinase